MKSRILAVASLFQLSQNLVWYHSVADVFWGPFELMYCMHLKSMMFEMNSLVNSG